MRAFLILAVQYQNEISKDMLCKTGTEAFIEAHRLESALMSKIPHWKAYLALALGTMIIATSAIFTRLAEAPGSVISLYRMGIAAVALAVPFALSRRNQPAITRRGL